MLKVCLDCTVKLSERAKISVLLLLLCIFSWLRLIWGCLCVLWSSLCGMDSVGLWEWCHLPSGVTELCRHFALHSAPLPLPLVKVILMPLSKKGEFGFLFYPGGWFDPWRGCFTQFLLLKGADLRPPPLLWELHGGCSSAGRVRDAQKCLT